MGFPYNDFISPEEKGEIGEDIIYYDLDHVEGRKAFLPNCYIPKYSGGTTEIDLIFLHESGVYVIESKNYSGWIFGDEEQEYWTQCLRSARGIAEQNRFYNPLWQNEIHIYALMELLRDDTFPYYSYIVFGNDCELKDVRLTSGNHHVTYYRYLLQDISENAQQMGRYLSDEKMDELYSILVKFTEATDEQKARHIEEIRAKQYPVVQPDGTWTCPRCGGVLVECIAQRGSRAGKRFWGCSNYPTCKFIYDGKNMR